MIARQGSAGHAAAAPRTGSSVPPPGLPLWAAGLPVFGASCATLVLEIVAGRWVAPFVGVSLHTWTSIVGAVLAGISIGSWLGSRLADRRTRLVVWGRANQVREGHTDQERAIRRIGSASTPPS